MAVCFCIRLFFLPYAESTISHEGFSVNRLLSQVVLYRASSSDERWLIA